MNIILLFGLVKKVFKFLSNFAHKVGIFFKILKKLVSHDVNEMLLIKIKICFIYFVHHFTSFHF